MRLEHDPSYESCEPGSSAFIAALANVYAGRLDRYVELATIADSYGGASRAFARPALVDGLQSSGRVDEVRIAGEASAKAARVVPRRPCPNGGLWTSVTR